jgi:ankyrin repeat protein
MQASKCGHLEVARLLLEQGAHVDENPWKSNCDSSFEHTALNEASTFGRAELVELLLENGAHVYPGILRHLFRILSQSDESRRRDYGGLLDVALLLLEKGADVNASEHGTTILMRAVVQGNPKMVQLLLRYEADANATDNKGLTPLMMAAEAHSANNDDTVTIARLLLQHDAHVRAATKGGGGARH